MFLDAWRSPFSTSDRVLSVRRDHDIIDSELRLLVAVRRSIRQHGINRRIVRSTNCSTSALAHCGRPGDVTSSTGAPSPTPSMGGYCKFVMWLQIILRVCIMA